MLNHPKQISCAYIYKYLELQNKLLPGFYISMTQWTKHNSQNKALIVVVHKTIKHVHQNNHKHIQVTELH